MCLTGREESVVNYTMRNVRASGANFFRDGKIWKGVGWGLVELEESLAVTSKSRRLEERLKAITGR